MGIPRNHDQTPLPKDDTGAAGRKCCAPKADAKQARKILILGLAVLLENENAVRVWRLNKLERRLQAMGLSFRP